ncbi:MAG: radical SAM protein [Bacteriovoracaceae bacterium]|nr:radical SAM protein [Bacteriovoracaceae bacterium]
MERSGAHPENVMMPVDLAIMMAQTKDEGDEYHIIDTEAEPATLDEVIRSIEKIGPDLIVIKAKAPTIPLIHKLYALCTIPMIGIGQAFNSESEKLLSIRSPLLCIILGEPEITYFELFSAIKQNQSIEKIKGITYLKDNKIVVTEKRKLLGNLDLLPTPLYRPFLTNKYFSYYPTPFFLKKKIAFMMISRGCPFECIYCSPTLRNSQGKLLRHYSVGRVIREMSELERQGITIVHMRDDCFTADNRWTTEFCEELVKQGSKIKWMIQTHANCVDRDLLSLMKKANCITIGFGVESGSNAVLKRIQKYNDIDHEIDVFDWCKKIGIKTLGFFLIGSPEETMEDVLKTKELMKRICPDLIQVAFFTLYAGSKAYETYLTKEQKQNAMTSHHYNNIQVNISNMTNVDLHRMQLNLYLSYILKPRVFLRLAFEVLVGLSINPAITFRLVLSGTKFLWTRPLRLKK